MKKLPNKRISIWFEKLPYADSHFGNCRVCSHDRGGSNDPAIFNSDIFNFQRIRLAPTLVLIGFGLRCIPFF